MYLVTFSVKLFREKDLHELRITLLIHIPFSYFPLYTLFFMVTVILSSLFVFFLNCVYSALPIYSNMLVPGKI